MKFSKKRFFIISSLLLATTFNTSCSAFFGEEGYVITDASQTQNENGDTVLTLTFSDTEKKPLVITIPKGVSGKDGVGILSITPTLIEDRVKITIKFTDPKIEDTVIEVPVVQGKDGKGIGEVVVGSDEIGNTTIQFKYTDGTEGELITIPKGNDGNGIAKFETFYDSENHKTKIHVTFTNGTLSTFEISDGLDGVSITSLEYDDANSDSHTYCVVVTYSNGLQTNIKLPRPIANTWHNGVFDNPPIDLGINGDFYINVTNGKVFLKENNAWVPKFSIKEDNSSSIEPATVLFMDELPNKTTNPIVVNGIKGKSIELTKIPIPPARIGYKFIGWYSARQNDNSDYLVNAGKFTDLTVLSKDALICYSWWVKI